MIEIGLIGAPKAGKTALARAVATSYYDPNKFPVGIIVDNISGEFEKNLYLGVGAHGTPQINLMLFFERMRRERLATQKFPNEPFIISCGTDVDSLAYSQWVMEIFDFGFITPEMKINAERALLALQTIAHYSAFNFDRKTLLYYLPLEGKKIKHEDEGFYRMIDKQIKSVIFSAKLTIPVLHGEPHENVDRILTDIREQVAVPVSA